MKQIIFSIFIISIYAFSNPDYTYSDWSEWQNSSCYKGLDFRTRRFDTRQADGTYEWQVQFRDRYYQKISFDHTLSEPNVKKETTDRMTVSTMSESSTNYFYLYSTKTCTVWINNVRFGNDDWGSSYYKCDQ